MFDLEAKRKRAAGEEGFTLIELLVVIIILGILAAVVVFSVGGVNDKGQTSACQIDTRTLRTAQEAYSAQPSAGNGLYGDMTQLKDGGFLSEASTLHTVTKTGTPVGKTFTINVVDSRCGLAGALVGTTNPDGTKNY